jgi:nuclear pore complex protein Nup133
LADQFQQLRPEVLNTLSESPLRVSVELSLNDNTDKYGFSARAFELAEKYRDFRSLAALCNKDQVYPLEQNPHTTKIAEYIERFREEFTDELYQWYIEHGINHVLCHYTLMTHSTSRGIADVV